jgi:hypothetical protein
VKRARAHLNIIGLQNHAALPRPEGVQGQDNVLKAFWLLCHNPVLLVTLARRSNTAPGNLSQGDAFARKIPLRRG